MKTFIFDFDGTIVDTFDSTINILHSISKYTSHNITKEFIKKEIRTKHIKEIINDFNINSVQMLLIMWKIRSELKKEREDINSITSMKQVLIELHKKGYHLILVTSNIESTVSHFLDKENICVFSEIYYKSGLFNKNKIINKIIKKNNLDKKEVYYVGDEIRDILCAKKSNINSISVTWGFNSKELLKEENPDYIIDSPQKLLEIH
ncbi:MAG: HAD hydrolase-like protein [Nanoarchaeota archaeon]|nr:HAD hydrolase-like protein [Nanoarchaeota archaeon]MEC8339473.1 HAD hydrolase-like protein [Nanoarchaeota archaeon]